MSAPPYAAPARPKADGPPPRGLMGKIAEDRNSGGLSSSTGNIVDPGPLRPFSVPQDRFAVSDSNLLAKIGTESGLPEGAGEDLGLSVLEYARSNKVSELLKVLAIGADVSRTDESGYTAVHWAAITGHAPCMMALLHAGADPNVTDHGGWTPLHYAAYKGHRSCCMALLVQKNIDIEVKNPQKKTAAQLAAALSGKNAKQLSQVIKDSAKPNSRILVNFSERFWKSKVTSIQSEPSVADPDGVVAAQIQIKGQLEAVQSDLEHQQRVLEKDREAETELRRQLDTREAAVAKLESELRDQLLAQGEKQLDDNVFTIQDPSQELELMEEIGKGTFGVVWKAKYRGDMVAVKKIDVNAAVADGEGVATDTEVVKAFQEEAGLLARLRHPNIVLLMGVACKLPELILVVELMQGTMQSLLLSKEKLSWPERLRLAVGAARGLNYLHSLGLVHRDVKSENLLVDEFRTVKVSDFGTVVTYEKLGREIVGTTSYMSPERLIGEESDRSTDVFSFGVVLWELINRKVPWKGQSNLQIVARVGHAGELLELPDKAPHGCPGQFIPLIRECWSSVSRRPPFEEVLARLSALIVEASADKGRGFTLRGPRSVNA